MKEKKKEEKEYKAKTLKHQPSLICGAHKLTEACQTVSGQPLKENIVLFHPPKLPSRIHQL